MINLHQLSPVAAPAALRKALAASVGLVLLASCAPSVGFEKPDADPATTARDYEACKRVAMRAEVQSSGPLDEPFGSSVSSFPRTSPRREYIGEADLSAAGVRAVLADCMRSRGYAAVPQR